MQGAGEIALLTDLYELTMAQGYFQSEKIEPATFSLFIRSYPPNRGYFVSAGLEDVLRFLSSFAFNQEAIDYLYSTRIFKDDFLDFLKDLRFTGEVWAIPEGRLFFKDEPVIEITAPVIEGQIVETFIINQINLQTLIATKAARCVYAAGGRGVVDFSLRRTQGIDAGMKAARSSYLAGFAGTSNVLAGKRYGIPIVGTMAHSFISSFEYEIDAFRNFTTSFPENSILLVDTYDTLAGAAKAVKVAQEMAGRGYHLRGVRIDSGDLIVQAREVRQMLDQAGLPDVKIIGSGGLDEYDLTALSEANAPYDSFGVGTKMGVSGDAPWYDNAYKLVEYNGRPTLKLSTGKISWPGRKQAFRYVDRRGQLQKDILALRDENTQRGEPLLKKVMERGKPISPYPLLQEIRERFLDEINRLDKRTKAVRNPLPYPVKPSPRLRKLRREIKEQISETELASATVSQHGLGES
ncbi:MAG: nicotinate phosphoribosyltransferase [Candidatus Binatia bacterium]